MRSCLRPTHAAHPAQLEHLLHVEMITLPNTMNRMVAPRPHGPRDMQCRPHFIALQWLGARRTVWGQHAPVTLIKEILDTHGVVGRETYTGTRGCTRWDTRDSLALNHSGHHVRATVSAARAGDALVRRGSYFSSSLDRSDLACSRPRRSDRNESAAHTKA